MMNIISVTEITKINPWVVVLIIASWSVFIISLVWLPRTRTISGAVRCFVLAIASACTFVFVAVNGDDPAFTVGTERFRIEATFTDDMSFNAVMQEYDIIEQHGDVFILESKNRLVAEGLREE